MQNETLKKQKKKIIEPLLQRNVGMRKCNRIICDLLSKLVKYHYPWQTIPIYTLCKIVFYKTMCFTNEKKKIQVIIVCKNTTIFVYLPTYLTYLTYLPTYVLYRSKGRIAFEQIYRIINIGATS